MRKTIISTIAALLGLAFGLLGGRVMRSGNPVTETPAPGFAGIRPAERANRGTADQPLPHTLKNLHRAFRNRLGGSAMEKQLARMTSAELRDWVTGDWPDAGDPAVSSQTRGFLLQLIAAELYRRHGEEALRWADGLEKGRRYAVLQHMVLEAAGADPVMAKPWVDMAMKDFGRISNYQIRAEEGARSRSAEELARVQEIYSGAMSPSMGGASYAEDFDFRKFVELRLGKGSIGSTVTAWAARDGEAAAAEIIGQSQQSKDAAKYTGALFQGVAAVQGDQAAARWIAGKLDGFPADLRDQAVKSLSDNMPSRSQVEAVLAALPTPQDRQLYAAEVIQPLGDPSSSLAAMRAFDSVDSQTAILVDVASKYQNMVASKAYGSAGTLKFFQSTMEKLSLPESSRQQVMDSLILP